MKHFLFATTEGYTFHLYSELAEPEIENLQILSFASANSIKEAESEFIQENSYLENLKYDEVLIFELVNPQPIGSISLNEIFNKSKNYV